MSFVWQCICGHMEHSDILPEDCPKCLRVGDFDKVPDEELVEREEESILSMQPEEDEDED